MRNQHVETDTTRATARLPGLEIEIVHRRPADNVEQISINLQAVPSFEAFGRFLESANPFAFWTRAARMAWLPWLEFARMMAPPGSPATLPPLRASGSTRPEDDDA